VSGIFWNPPDHADLTRSYDDDEPAGPTYRTWPKVPSERHRQVLKLLHANSRRDHAGRLVSWWPQDKLARKLGMSDRHLRRLLADLREPGSDPRQPQAAPAGLRLGLVKVEPTYYRDAATGRYRLGGNLYVLLDAPPANPQVTGQTPSVRQRDMAEGAVSAGRTDRTSDAMSCLNKGEEPPRGEEVLSPAHAREDDPLDVGHQQPSSGFDHDPTRAEVLAALEGGLGPVEVIDQYPNDRPPRPRPVWVRVTDRWTLDLANADIDTIRRAMGVLGMFDKPAGRPRRRQP
jgi:hypothetical protein